MAKRKTLFDDRPIEVSELTYIIRQDIASLNTQIASLQSYVRAQKPSGAGGGKGQVEEHNSNVVMLLQSRLANMGMGFKDVLELRTQVSKRRDVSGANERADASGAEWETSVGGRGGMVEEALRIIRGSGRKTAPQEVDRSGRIPRKAGLRWTLLSQ